VARPRRLSILPPVAGLALAVLMPGPAPAADVAPDETVSATPQRVARPLAGAAQEAAPDAARDDDGGLLADVHGEVSAMVGTGGAYALSGTATLPLGDDGSLTLSFETGAEDLVAPHPAGPWDRMRAPLIAR